jgi:chromosome segregation ATPase
MDGAPKHQWDFEAETSKRDEMEEMNPRTGRREEEIDDAQEYLTNLKGLSSELERAMEAIVSRELAALQDSLQIQRSRCARLSDLQQSAKVRQLLKSPSASSADRDLSLEIESEVEAATEVLLMRSRQYSALLRHAGETLRLLAGLYRGYVHPNEGQRYLHQGHGRTADGQRARQGWHCEM